MLRELFNWRGTLSNLIIERQDRRVVVTQLPKCSDMSSGEKLIQCDGPMIKYRRRRVELIEAAGKMQTQSWLLYDFDCVYNREGNKMKAFHLVLALLALSLISPARLEAWSYTSGQFQRATLPPQSHLLVSSSQADLDNDGVLEELVLLDKRALIISSGKTAWISPDGWQVVQASFTDLNHDGRPEVTLLVWRAFQPWPIDRYLPHGGRIQDFHNSDGMSCHLILISWQRGALREQWAGSALADPLRSFIAADLDGDGRQELLALESRYDDPSSAPSRALTAWEWNGFGFTLLARHPGRFLDFIVVQQGANDPILLLHW